MKELILSGEYTGVAESLDFEDYRKAPYVNWSFLRTVRERSIRHAVFQRDNPTEKTSAMQLGSDTHCAVLEPERFAKDYVRAPQVDKRTKEGKAAWEKLERENPGAQILKQDDFDQIADMARAVSDSPFGKIFQHGRAELSIFWVNPLTGLKCKARLDYYRQDVGLLADLKTTTLAAPAAFAKAIRYEMYHAQLAFYLDGLTALKLPARSAVIVAVEKDAPHVPASYQLAPSTVLTGRLIYEDALSGYALAAASGVIPGYAKEIVTLNLEQMESAV